MSPASSGSDNVRPDIAEQNMRSVNSINTLNKQTAEVYKSPRAEPNAGADDEAVPENPRLLDWDVRSYSKGTKIQQEGLANLKTILDSPDC